MLLLLVTLQHCSIDSGIFSVQRDQIFFCLPGGLLTLQVLCCVQKPPATAMFLRVAAGWV